MEHIDALQSDLSLGTRWLSQMGEAAHRYGLTIQYCMSLPRHVLSAVHIPAVTQVSNLHRPLTCSATVNYNLSRYKKDLGIYRKTLWSCFCESCYDSGSLKLPAVLSCIIIIIWWHTVHKARPSSRLYTILKGPAHPVMLSWSKIVLRRLNPMTQSQVPVSQPIGWWPVWWQNAWT